MMTIEKRMDKLEQQNRQLKLGLLALLALMVGAFLIGAADGFPDEISTKKLNIVDNDGNPKLVLYSYDETSGIVMEGPSGSIIIQTDESSAGLFVSTPESKQIISLSSKLNKAWPATFISPQ